MVRFGGVTSALFKSQKKEQSSDCSVDNCLIHQLISGFYDKSFSGIKNDTSVLVIELKELQTRVQLMFIFIKWIPPNSMGTTK